MNSIQIEHTNCGVCESSDWSLLFPDTTLSESGKRGIVRCSHCGLVYRNIRKTADAILEQYSAKEYGYLSHDWIKGRKNVFRPYVKALSRFKYSGNILDVGAGHGFFLAACKEAGWNCSGVEPSLQCRGFAEREFGIHLSAHTVQHAAYQNDFFDITTFWNVLSHLPDPKNTLSYVYSLLRPGGAVVIREPNSTFHVTAKLILSFLGKIIPAFRSLDQTVFHLYAFDQHTLLRMLRDVGFENIRTSPARLSWTTTQESASNRTKQLLVRIVETGFKCGFFLTAKRWLLSPSLLTIGIKPDTYASEQCS